MTLDYNIGNSWRKRGLSQCANSDIMVRMQEWTFADELRLSRLNVVRAALHFAQEIAYSDLDIPRVLQQINNLTIAAGDHIAAEISRLRQSVLLAEFLFKVDGGLRGNAGDYNDPRNSYLNEVLTRRLGIPISLSVIYIEIAQRLHIPAYGISLPGHFIVGVEERGQHWYLDPFHGGGRVSVTDCARLVQANTGYKGSFDMQWLQPALEADILARMLTNLRVIYVQRSLWDLAVAVIERLCMVQPQIPEHVRDLGLVHYRKRSLRLAATYLDAYLRAVPDASDAEAIRKGMRDILDEWTRLN